MRRCALSPDAVIAKRDIRRLEHTVWKPLRSENKYFLTWLEIDHACLLICDYLRARRHDDFLFSLLVRHGQCLTIDTCGLARHSGIGHCAIGQVPVREAFGRVHARWEDEDRRCLLAAVGLPEAVMARYEPSFMSESGAFTTSLTGALSASLIFISPPSRAFAVTVPPSTLAMVARTRTNAGACAETIETVKRKAIVLAPAILRVIIAIIVLPLLLLWLASLAASLKTRLLRYSSEFTWERAERRVRTR